MTYLAFLAKNGETIGTCELAVVQQADNEWQFRGLYGDIRTPADTVEYVVFDAASRELARFDRAARELKATFPPSRLMADGGSEQEAAHV